MSSKSIYLSGGLSMMAILASCGFSSAAELRWDVDPSTAGIQEGAGAPGWNVDPANLRFWNGASNVAWDNTLNAADIAQFGGSQGGAVTVAKPVAITAGGLIFASGSTGNYTLAGGGGVLTLGGTSAATIKGITGTGGATTIGARIDYAIGNSGGLFVVNASPTTATLFGLTIGGAAGNAGVDRIAGPVTIGSTTAGENGAVNVTIPSGSSQGFGTATSVTVNPGSSVTMTNTGQGSAGVGATLILTGGKGAAPASASNYRGQLFLGDSFGSWSGPVTLSGTGDSHVRFNGNSANALNGVVSESGGSHGIYYQAHNGALASNTQMRAWGINSYTGSTTLNVADLSGSTATLGIKSDRAFGAVPASSAAINFTGVGNDGSVNTTGHAVLRADEAGIVLHANRVITVTDIADLTINTNGFDMGVDSAIASAPLIKKSGVGVLTLVGSNTYAGNTSVDAGTLVLASTGSLLFDVNDGSSNQIVGTGAVTLNGTFKLDVSGVTEDGSWTLVAGTLADAHSGSFAVALADSTPFVQTADVWTLTSGGFNYSYAEEFGVLSAVAIPEPASMTIFGLAGLAMLRRRR